MFTCLYLVVSVNFGFGMELIYLVYGFFYFFYMNQHEISCDFLSSLIKYWILAKSLYSSPFGLC